MIGAMVYKDVAIIKRTARMYLLLVLLYLLMTMSGVFEGTGMVNSFAAMFSVSVPLGCFSLDELARWEKFAITLPLGRKGVVQAKYAMVLLLTVVTSLFIVLMNLALFAFFPSQIPSLPAGLLSAVAMTAGCLLVHALLTPACFKYGVQKARVAIFIALAAAVAIMIPLGMMTTLPLRATAAISGWNPLVGEVGVLVAGALVAAMLLLFVSYRLSLRIYEKKEF